MPIRHDAHPQGRHGARPTAARGALAVAFALLAFASAAAAQTVTVLTHGSFAVSRSVVEAFTERTGIEVRFVSAGDAGSTLNRAILTRERPLADVLFGVDEASLPRALAADLFEPYTSPALAAVDPAYRLDAFEGVVTPVDAGFVTFNLDRAAFKEAGLAPPASLDDLADPRYRGLTVVTDPATSSPGLLFMLGTIGVYGEEGWLDYWAALRDNDLSVTSGWSEAYYTAFSRYGGDRPIVLSYASSPAAEVIFADEPLDEAPTANLRCSGCSVRQVEAAGVLRGAREPEAARAFVDFLLSAEFQEDVPMQMFVYPVRAGTPLPSEFHDFAEVPAPDEVAPLPDDLAAERLELWLTQWTEVVMYGRDPGEVR
jgi:thiamine transport system substrate-binding protein